MYAAGRSHPFKRSSADFLRAVGRREIDAVSDVEVLQEILHRYRAVRRDADGFVVFESFATTVRLFHSVLPSRTCGSPVRCSHATIPCGRVMRIHAAVMLRTGVRTIVSYDRHFDELSNIVRVTPRCSGAERIQVMTIPAPEAGQTRSGQVRDPLRHGPPEVLPQQGPVDAALAGLDHLVRLESGRSHRRRAVPSGRARFGNGSPHVAPPCTADSGRSSRWAGGCSRGRSTRRSPSTSTRRSTSATRRV